MALLDIGISLTELGLLLVISLGIAHLLKKVDVPTVLGLILGGLCINIFLILTKLSLDSLLVDYSALKLIITDFALAWIGFEIGAHLDLDQLKKNSFKYGLILLGQALGPFLLVSFIFYVLLNDLVIALILGSIAMATAPAATSQILKEYDSKGDLTNTILFIVALDDILCILFVNVSVGLVEVNGSQTGIFSAIFASIILVTTELVYSIILAVVTLFFILLLIKLSIINELTILEWLLGFSLVLIAFSLVYQLSVILSMFIWGLLLKIMQNREGFALLNNQTQKLDILAIPILLLFFILIGLSMEIEILLQLGTLTFAVLYFVLRLAGKGFGSYVSSYVSGVSSAIKNNLPFSLLTQAGVAIGLAGLAFQSLTAIGRVDDALFILNIVGITVILSELLGPFFLKFAILRSGEGAFKSHSTELLFE